MLYLVLEVGTARYALDVGQVTEVLPLVRITPIPRAPTGIAGAFDFRGTPVPVVDLSDALHGRPTTACLGTRLVLVTYPDRQGTPRQLGLVAEHVTDTLRCDPEAFTDSGVHTDDAPYLGPVTTGARGIVQRVDVAALLPPAISDALFRDLAETPWPLQTSSDC